MCGIIAYTGYRSVAPILVDGLKRLEYRGYDSAGVAFFHDGRLQVVKTPGKLSALERILSGNGDQSREGASKSGSVSAGPTCGIGHTRWATHGPPTRANAHPHCDHTGSVALAHNGIIENHAELRSWLEKQGYVFVSDTDTEVLSHLVAEGQSRRQGSPSRGLAWALSHVEGSYAVALMCSDRPGEIWAARQASPLLLGLEEEEYFLASDIPAFLTATRNVVFLEDGEMVHLTDQTWRVMDISELAPKEKQSTTINWDLAAAEKNGYPHFMLKEILEQPQVIRDCLRGRTGTGNTVRIPKVESFPVPSRIRILACGTSFHAGLWAKYLFEEWSDIPTEVEIASEFRYRRISFSENEVAVAISQSGETADTMAGLQIARECGIPVIGLCNVVGSSIARASDTVLYTQAGPEISVASTKAMCSQMAALLLLAVYWGRQKGELSSDGERTLVQSLARLPDHLESILPSMRTRAQELVGDFQEARGVLFLGRGLGYPLALEGALKLKEISYIHAEGYAAGEMKHGPIALIEECFPTFAVDLGDRVSGKLLSNLQEVKARYGPVILLAPSEVHFNQAERWDLPRYTWPLSSFAVLPAIQLLAYEMAVLLGKDVDQPRNLAKSVTVE